MSTPTLSLIICAYNPDDIVFSRTLLSVQNLVIPTNINIECLIIDNNSRKPLQEVSYVKDFLSSCKWAKVVFEGNQGLTFARIKGIQSSTSPFLIFVDDDNELSPNYLQAALNHLILYPHVGAWGPGRISVDFVNPVPKSFQEKFRHIFQEKDSSYVEYGNVPGKWMEFYPFGTGLIINRQVAEKYCDLVTKGILSSTDRCGSSLSSGGDIQIVWEAIKMGYSAGTSPELQVNHLIPKQRANFNYVKRLIYGNSSSYWPALIQSFPERKEFLSKRGISSKTILKKLIGIAVYYGQRFNFSDMQIELARSLGEVVGMLNAAEKERLFWVHKLALIFNLN